MPDLASRILHELARKDYKPLKPKPLAKRLGILGDDYRDFRKSIRALLTDGRLEQSGDHTLRLAKVDADVFGVYRRVKSGHGYVRPLQPEGAAEIFIRAGHERDAITGDEVAVRLTRRASKMHDAGGEITRILKRANRTFVGTYFERDGEAFVRVDGTVFAHSVSVGDPGAKGANPQDKVVVEMVRFPTVDDRGEGVVIELLGPQHEPGVDLLTIIKTFNLPEEFPDAVLADAQAQADKFDETDLQGRTDFTRDCVLTIDPADARDFDDAVSVTVDPKTGHWVLTVHIADVAHFAAAGSPLDAEAKKRATSIYLPRKVIPMFPEVVSNGLASLQEGKVRFVKTVRMEFTPGLQKGHVELFNGVIRVRKRFHYEEVQAILDSPVKSEKLDPDVAASLGRMRELAVLLRKKRIKRGSLELNMPEPVLEYDDQGRVSGAHFAVHDESHRMVEECMLAANEAVAEHFTRLGIPFLRRVHPMPNEEKLDAFAQFTSLLGYPMKRSSDRFELQRVLRESESQPERAAIHYSLLRSLKQATYSPVQDEHYALASQNYCHFTSPIRRYPDLTVHRLLDRWLRHGNPSAAESELQALGDHCSKMERRAETAERELVKLKLLQYLSTRVGEEFDAVITGVADYGFFAQAERIPAEGLVHISSLTDDYYHHDEEGHSLTGGRRRRRFRLGDRVRVIVARVDLQRRMLDFRLASELKQAAPVAKPKRTRKRK